MDKKWSFPDLGALVTNKTSVMTPLIILNAVLLIVGSYVYVKTTGILILIAWLFLLGFTLAMYALFAIKAPWYLSGQKIALAGMKMFGTKKVPATQVKILEAEPVNNPELRGLKQPRKSTRRPKQ